MARGGGSGQGRGIGVVMDNLRRGHMEEVSWHIVKVDANADGDAEGGAVDIRGGTRRMAVVSVLPSPGQRRRCAVKRRTILQHSTVVTYSGSLLRLDGVRFVDKFTRKRWREISKARE